MSRFLNPILLCGVISSVCVQGDSVASAAAPSVKWTSLGSLYDWIDDPVGEAVSEAFYTLSFFLGIWVWGRTMGWKFGGSKSGKKAVSKVALRGGDQAPRAVAAAKPPKQVEVKLDSLDFHKGDGESSTQLRQRQARGTTASEADALAAAVRAGRAAELPRLFDLSVARVTRDAASAQSSREVAETLFVACLRACAAKRCFIQALALYDHVKGRIGKACSNTWSLLLWGAVESNDFELCGELLQRLVESGTPTSYDFVNIVRYYANTGDQDAFVKTLSKLQASGCQIDVFARNRALSLCMIGRTVGLAQKIVELVPSVPMDAIAYNTMMKGFANVGDLVSCFAQYTEMRRADVMPTEMTFGILLDACIDDKQMEHARRVFTDLRDSGLPLNVILYTTFIKGLVNAGELTEAMAILDEMCDKATAKPDLVTFSTLVKAHASAGNVADCARLLERMLKMGIQPDSVLFNTILNGCCHKAMDPAQVLHVFSWLVNKGLQPSTATISVLIKAFSLSKSWGHALDVLEAAPARYGTWPEARVYGQLAQSCAKENDGQAALAAYASMVKAAGKQGIPVKSSHSARLQRVCAQCGQGARSAKIFQALADSEGRVDQRVRDVLEASA